MTFTVGKQEKHTVAFAYSTFTGSAKILVDGKEYSSSRIMIVGHTPFNLRVGDKEKHSVRIELDNPVGFAFRGSHVKVFVDDDLVQESHVGNSMPTFIAIAVVIIFLFVYFMLFLR